MSKQSDHYQPGQRVVVTQQIPHGEGVWSTRITGTVERYEQRKTGSWYAHAKDHKLWLDRLTIRKDDGEIVVCNLDPYTHVEVLADTESSAPMLIDDTEVEAVSESTEETTPEDQEGAADAA